MRASRAPLPQQQLVDASDELYHNPFERRLHEKQQALQRPGRREISGRHLPPVVEPQRHADASSRILSELDDRLKPFAESPSAEGSASDGSSWDSEFGTRPRRTARDEGSAAKPLARVEAEATAHAIDLDEELLRAEPRKSWRYFARRYKVPVSFPELSGHTARSDRTLSWFRWDDVLKKEKALHREEIRRERSTKGAKWKVKTEHLVNTDDAVEAQAAAEFQLAPEEAVEIRRIFELMDVNKDGDLSLDELRKAMESVMEDIPSMGELERWFKTSDSNNDNAIQFSEFLESMRIHYMFDREARNKAAAAAAGTHY